MKVLHIYKTYMPDTVGGVETAIQELSQGMKTFGVESQILTVSNREQINTDDQITVNRLKKSFSISSCPFSINFMRQFRDYTASADIIHYHFPWPFAEMMHLYKQVDKPSLVTYHSDIVRQWFLKPLYRPLMKAFLTSVDCIVTTSQNYLDTSEDLKPFRDKCIVIPIGLTDNFKQDGSSTLNKWKQRFQSKFILYIGATRYYKGLHLLLDTAGYTDADIVIAGSGPLDDLLKERVSQENLSNVHLIGQVSQADKAALLRLATGVILPSHLRSEAFGVTLVEGLMYAKPLISTSIGTGTSYINQHKETGIVVPANNVKQMLKAINTLYYDETSAQRYGEAARQRYLQYFTQESYCKKYMDAYRWLLEGNKMRAFN